MKPTIVIYTHTDVIDVWSPFFGQTEKYLNDFKKVIFVNEHHKDIPSDYQVVVYDDSKKYRDRLLYCLEAIDDDYIIFHHEDMFLYGEPNIQRILDYTKYLDSNFEMSFIKLIRGGVSVGESDKNIPALKLITDKFDYIFAIQPCIWKTHKLIEMIDYSNGADIWDFEVKAQEACRRRGILGWYVDDGGVQRGKYHWDSKVYPYVATAVVKGRWNTREYPEELSSIFEEYNIDLSKREKNG